ncbi:MAG: WbqC family protein [Granulicella sp.]
MQVAIIQSSYIPWKGYFDIIHDVDKFIFLDDVQFTIRDWRSRNRIKTAQGPAWLSVPVGAKRSRLIREVELIDHEWQKTHWKTLTHAYGGTPFFNHYREFFEGIYLGSRWRNLSQMNQAITTRIAVDLLGVRTSFHDSHEYGCSGKRDDLLLSILKKAEATSYLSGPAAKNYIDPGKFAEAGIELQFKDYSNYPEYPQFHPPFEHAVSIVDLLFHTGPGAKEYLWGWRGTHP